MPARVGQAGVVVGPNVPHPSSGAAVGRLVSGGVKRHRWGQRSARGAGQGWIDRGPGRQIPSVGSPSMPLSDLLPRPLQGSSATAARRRPMSPSTCALASALPARWRRACSSSTSRRRTFAAFGRPSACRKRPSRPRCPRCPAASRKTPGRAAASSGASGHLAHAHPGSVNFGGQTVQGSIAPASIESSFATRVVPPAPLLVHTPAPSFAASPCPMDQGGGWRVWSSEQSCEGARDSACNTGSV